MDIHSNSQESLLLLKDRISKIAPSTTVEEVMKYVEKSIKDNDLNATKLVNKLVEAVDRTPDIRSPYYFIVKVTQSIIRDKLDEVKDSKLVLAFTPLWLDMKAHNFSGEEVDYVLLTLIETHCFNEFPIEPKELVETNHAIMDYCVANNKCTYKDFKDLFLRSKLAKKCNIPMVTLEEKAKEQVAERERILAELDNNKEDPYSADY